MVQILRPPSFFPIFILVIWSCNVIHLKIWRSLNSSFAVQFNLSIPHHITGISRCEHVHPLSRVNVYISSVKIILW